MTRFYLIATFSLVAWACAKDETLQNAGQQTMPVAEGSAGCSAVPCAAGQPAQAAAAGATAGGGAGSVAQSGAPNPADSGQPPDASTPAVGSDAALPVDATMAQPEARPGAVGIGDAYFPENGNGGFDVRHYDIRLRYEPGKDQLTGTTTISLTPSEHLSRFNLDFVLDVSEVSVAGVAAKFARESGHELVITPAKSLPAGQAVDVVVKYSGVPSSIRVSGVKMHPWWRTRDGAVAAGAPENAWWWFPSNDHPLDKATFAVSATVPEGLVAISNGVQTAPPVAAETGWATWSWLSSKPQQPNLALLVIGDYELMSSVTATGMPLTLAYSKRVDGQIARACIARTEEIVRWEETVFGPYPFEALGGVLAPTDGIDYALETQTRPIYPNSYFSTRVAGSSVVAHENAHQWFGDSVAVARWQDVWLSEGFATYAEWLWSEAQGEGTAQEIFDETYAMTPESNSLWQVVIGNPGKDRIYDWAVYKRGAMTLHQLRVTIGDSKFFELLPKWTAERRHGNATIEDFKALASSISGQNLDELFKAWLFTAGRPKVAQANMISASEYSRRVRIPETHLWHRPLSPNE